MAADALAPWVARSSAALILTLCNVGSLVFLGSKFQQPLMLQCQGTMWNANIFFSIKNSALQGKIQVIFNNKHLVTYWHWANWTLAKGYTPLSLYPISHNTSHHKISWNLEAARDRFSDPADLKFDRCLSSSAAEALVKFQNDAIIVKPILWLRDFTRFSSKTSYRLVNRGPDFHCLIKPSLTFTLWESILRLFNWGRTTMTTRCAPAFSQALPVKPQGVWATGIEAWARGRDRWNLEFRR